MFTEESASKITQCLNPHTPPEPDLSSRLLNRQLKAVIHKLHRDLTVSVLGDLEKAMRTRTEDAWGPSLATILILCLCMEGLQTAADTYVVSDLLKEGTASKYTRKQSSKVCWQLEDYPFEQCRMLFHEIYKSHKDGSVAFNPLRAVWEGRETRLDRKTDAMVRSTCGLLQEHCKLILKAFSETSGLIAAQPMNWDNFPCDRQWLT